MIASISRPTCNFRKKERHHSFSLGSFLNFQYSYFQEVTTAASCLLLTHFLAGILLFKVNSGNSRAMCEIFSSVFFIANFFLLLNIFNTLF